MSTTNQTQQDLEKAPKTRGMTRRAVTRGMAWTAPVVLTSVTVPAFAASPVPCTKRTAAILNLDNDDPVFKADFASSTVDATFSFRATNKAGSLLSDHPTPGDTGEVHRTNYPSGTNWNYLKLHHPADMNQGDLIVLTIDFTTPVSNLALTITDIDRYTTEWIDHVWVEPTPLTVVKTDPTFVEGAGTAADPWVADVPGDSDHGDGDEDDGVEEDDPMGITSQKGDVMVTWLGPLSQVKVYYKAADVDNDSPIGQHIGVGLITIDNC